MAKFKWNFKKNKQIDKVVDRLYDELQPGLLRAIKRDIVRGVSPVFGENWKKYSESYKDSVRSARRGKKESKRSRDIAKKQTGVVNLLLSGALLKSAFLRKSKKGVKLGFDDEKAEWHQLGKGNLPVRKLLPIGKKESFNERLSKIITKALKKAWKKR